MNQKHFIPLINSNNPNTGWFIKQKSTLQKKKKYGRKNPLGQRSQ